MYVHLRILAKKVATLRMHSIMSEQRRRSSGEYTLLYSEDLEVAVVVVVIILVPGFGYPT